MKTTPCYFTVTAESSALWQKTHLFLQIEAALIKAIQILDSPASLVPAWLCHMILAVRRDELDIRNVLARRLI